ncbi:hypothetical protein BZA70DRAFT_278734 [Myxozyma melibiosi]|uniref:Uncharacterized protein n=1 Tax=Myxozyma melibiosi TaxID=54550 RepID=A0ABR1F528_9ASCO
MATRRLLSTASSTPDNGSSPVSSPVSRSTRPSSSTTTTTTTSSSSQPKSVIQHSSTAPKSIISSSTRRKKSVSAKRISTDDLSFEDIEKNAIAEADAALIRQLHNPYNSNVEGAAQLGALKSSGYSTPGYESPPWVSFSEDESSETPVRAIPRSAPRKAGAPSLRFGQTASSLGNQSASSSSESSTAPKKAEKTTHISSDDYFGRNQPRDYERRKDLNRLHEQFDSATAISSDSYFGRPSPDSEMADQPAAEYALAKAKDLAMDIAYRAPDAINSLIGSAPSLDVQGVKGYIGKTAGSLWPGQGR